MSGSVRETIWDRPYVASVLLFFVGLFGCVLPATGFFSAVPGDLGDGRFNSVLLEHLFRLVTGQAAGLWDPGFFYPFPHVLAFSDNLFGSGAVYVAARLAGVPRELAVDVWFVTGSLMNFVAAHVALRRVGFSTPAAAIGAFIFAFGVPAGVAEPHMQLVYRFGVPLAALAFFEAVETRRPSALAATALWVTWQFYCAIYLGIFLVYLLAALAVAHVVVHKSLHVREWGTALRQRRRASIMAGLAILACLAATGYLLGVYAVTSRFYGFTRSLGEIATLLPRPGSYLLADGVPWVREIGRWLEVPARHEQQLFVGVGSLILVALGLVAIWRLPPLHPAGATFGLALVLLILGTISVGGISLYYLVAWLPGINSVRAVSRIGVVLLLPVGVLASLGVELLGRRAGKSKPWSVAVAGVAGVLAVAEPLAFQHYRTPIADWTARTAGLRGMLPQELAPDAVLLVRSDDPDVIGSIFRQLDAMIVAQDAGIATMNGYSGNEPPGFVLAGSCLEAGTMLDGYSKITGRTPPDISDGLVTVSLGDC